MSNAVAAQKPAEMFRSQLNNMSVEIGNALPPHIPPERFMRVVLTAVNGNPDLLNCDRKTLFESAMKAAQDGLLPDGRDGALVKFGASVQWMPMVGGILKKVRNSGELLSIAAHVVYDGDRFTYRLGDEESIEHEPSLGAERGKPIAVYAVAKTKDGGIYREVMSVSDVEKVRNVSRAKNSGPWVQWWDEMARKTVIRRLSKRLPMSSDLDDLIRRDDELYDFGASRDAAAPAPDTGLRARLAARQQAPTEGFSPAHVPRPAAPVETIDEDGVVVDAEAAAPSGQDRPAAAQDSPQDAVSDAGRHDSPEAPEAAQQATHEAVLAEIRDEFDRASTEAEVAAVTASRSEALNALPPEMKKRVRAMAKAAMEVVRNLNGGGDPE